MCALFLFFQRATERKKHKVLKCKMIHANFLENSFLLSSERVKCIEMEEACWTFHMVLKRLSTKGGANGCLGRRQ